MKGLARGVSPCRRERIGGRDPSLLSPQVSFSDLCDHLAGFLQCLEMQKEVNTGLHSNPAYIFVVIFSYIDI